VLPVLAQAPPASLFVRHAVVALTPTPHQASVALLAQLVNTPALEPVCVPHVAQEVSVLLVLAQYARVVPLEARRPLEALHAPHALPASTLPALPRSFAQRVLRIRTALVAQLYAVSALQDLVLTQLKVVALLARLVITPAPPQATVVPRAPSVNIQAPIRQHALFVQLERLQAPQGQQYAPTALLEALALREPRRVPFV
jgi:hypothetical protein